MKALDLWVSLLLAIPKSALAADWSLSGCSREHADIIAKELNYAKAMASASFHGVLNSPYYEPFFDEESRGTKGFDRAVAGVYDRMQQYLGDLVPSCSFDHPYCTDRGYAVFSTSPWSQTINFCPKFFASTEIKATEDIVQNHCSDLDLAEAHGSRSAVLAHVSLHTVRVVYAMAAWDRDRKEPILDYSLGVGDSLKLASGEFDRGCAPYRRIPRIKDKEGQVKDGDPLCPSSNESKDSKHEGVCMKTMSRWNADTYSLVASGIYYSEECKREIPFKSKGQHKRGISDAPPGLSRRSGLGASCSFSDDYMEMDGGTETTGLMEDPDHELDAYVHFGDSYASGMGTGVTSGDSCRIGSNNYGQLLSEWLGDRIDNFERLSCSGDTSEGVNKQIDKWQNYKQAGLGTLTLGGNDLGFSNLVMACILNFSGVNREEADKKCQEEMKKAEDLMNDSGEDGLEAQLTNVLVRIVTKAEKEQFKLYVAGYLPFFRTDTDDCDKAYFNFWGQHSDESKRLYLLKEKRTQLNGLVMSANLVMSNAIRTANSKFKGDRIFEVSLWNRWIEGEHSWCEEGAKEPDENRSNTWFFLGAWKDITGDIGDPEDGELKSGLSDEDKNALQKMSEMDPKTCADEQDKQLKESGGLDPVAQTACEMLRFFEDNPDSDPAKAWHDMSRQLRDGNVTVGDPREVPTLIPTYLAKTFHPRTMGMVMYRDAMIQSISKNHGGFKQ